MCYASNSLLARGAVPACDGRAILEALGKRRPGSSRSGGYVENERDGPPGTGGAIWELLRDGGMQIDSIQEKLGIPVTDILNEMTVLELSGYVIQRPGKVFERA